MSSHPLRCSFCGFEPDTQSAAFRYGGACPNCLKALVLEGLLEAPLPAPLPAGGEFGKFMLTDRLGKGGMGEVWKAFDKELKRWVALKFLRNDSPEELARFQREAKTAAALSHPGIAAIYEVGEFEGRHYIAMQYVEGRTLATYPREDRKTLARLIRDAARALEQAHRQGVIHRDLKPENLIVERAGDESRIMILDFGLARRIEGGESLSRSGAVVGTLAYMSPEQARGDKLDERTDVYSLGATLYEVLTGKPPFEGANVYEIMRKLEDTEPPSPRRLNPHVPHDLETITLKCLDKDRDRRYGAAKDLADDLQRFLDGDAVMARRQSTMYLLRKKLAKRKLLLTIGALGLAASVFLAIQWSHESSIRGQKELQVHETQLRALRKEQNLKQLNSLWTKLILAKQDLYRAHEDAARVRRPIEDVSREINQFVDQNPALPQAFYIAAKARLTLGDLRGAEEALRRATSLDGEFYPANALLARVLLVRYKTEPTLKDTDTTADRIRRLEDLLAEAQHHMSLGWSRGSEPGSIERWGIIKTRDDDVSDVLAKALVMYYVDKDAANARQYLEKANAAFACEEYCYHLGLMAKDPVQQIEWQTRALALLPHFSAAYLARADAYLDSMSPSRGGSSDNVRVTWRFTPEDQRKHTQALEDLDRALSIHPGSVEALLRRAWERYDFKGKIEDYTRALELGITPRHEESRVLSRRASNRRTIGDYAGAVADYTSAIEKSDGDRNEIAEWTFCRASNRKELGDHDGALIDYSQVIDVKNIGDYRSHYFTALFERAKIRKNKGERPAVIADLTKGIEDWKAVKAAVQGKREPPFSDEDFGRQRALRDVKISDWYWQLVLVRHESGDLQGARSDLHEAITHIDPPEAASLMLDWGKVREAAGDLAAADEANKKASELDPKTVGGRFYSRAMARLRAGDEDGGQADLARAVELNPKGGYEVWWHWRRALIHVENGRNEDARSAFKKSAESGPPADGLEGRDYVTRALARATIGDGAGAAADEARAVAKDARNTASEFFSHGRFLYGHGLFAESKFLFVKAADLPLWPEGRHYCRLYIWLAHASLGERSKGDLLLHEYLKAGHHREGDGWFEKIANFLLGTLSEEEFIRGTEVRDAGKDRQKERECEAYFYAGSRRRVDGDFDKARAYLEKCVATNLTKFMEYQSAQVELKRWPVRK